MKLPSPARVIIFDFDGVILDSAGIKLQAYASLYADEDPEKLKAVIEHSQLHGGITRRTKFIHYERVLFDRAGDLASIELLSQRYFDIVFEAVLACPFIAGAQDLLARANGKVAMHVVSGTPDNELSQIVVERGLAHFFRSVTGAPETKRDAFEKIITQEGCDRASVVAIGDSMTEYLAAEDAGISFLGIVPEGADNPFPAGVVIRPSLATADRLLGIG